jgi:hypothetical protein
MKITEQDINNFKHLKDSETQKWLVDYFERFVNDIYDVRNIGVADVEARKEFAGLVNTEIISRLKLASKNETKNLNEFN